MTKFSQRLSQLRQKNNLTIYDVEFTTGVPAATVDDYENGRKEPNIYYAKKLADFFGIDLIWLLGFKD